MVWHVRLCSRTHLSLLSQLRSQCLRSLGSSVHVTKPCSDMNRSSIAAQQSEDVKLKLSDLREAVRMGGISEDLVKVVVSDNPDLSTAATHLFVGEGKYFRPTCVMLMGECCNDGAPSTPAQREIALITELIHVASLLHDDVLDEAVLRRSLVSVNRLYNDKVAILTGDYVIALATCKLARLGCSKTITVLSSVIRDLIKGEIQQLNGGIQHLNGGTQHLNGGTSQLNGGTEQPDMFSSYIDKSYHKTASLIAHGCQAVVLNSSNPQLQHSAFNYGRYLGITYQLIDDMLDFVASSEDLGKETGSDLQAGLATAPVLYAASTYPQLQEVIARGFRQSGDVQQTLEMVHSSRGVQRTKQLAEHYTEKALSELEPLPECSYKTGLTALCHIVLNRAS